LTASTQSLKPDELRQKIALVELELWKNAELLDQAKAQIVELESMVASIEGVAEERAMQIRQLKAYAASLEVAIEHMADVVADLEKQVKKERRQKVVVAIIGGIAVTLTAIL